MLTINNKTVTLKKNDSSDGIIVKKIYKDSVKVEFKKEIKTILK